ncbi:Armadillo beta-catenin repeat family protein [Musa troglodytarum]|uniref:Armadillo beta-catenin repeat family protein n=1 Tax=Musa troglodytarum TaxID=320322 RepID=A0A9E7GDE8_9LILI|nr:Armadillo beta-catenin repeat family protein [Musa troglodytarum]
MKEEREKACLRQASQLLGSLVSSPFSVRCFPRKWQLIRSKLEQLLSGLAAAADGNFLSGNSEVDLLLKSMLSTFNDLESLLLRCGDESCVGGKLLLRSDLDGVASRLGLHSDRLAELYASGNATHSRAIVLTKPSSNASREDIRFYVRDLFSRLKIGDTSMRLQALASLREVLREHDEYVRIVATDTADALSLLVSFLEHTDDGLREKAAGVLSVIAEFDSYKGLLVAAGAIAPLMPILEKGTELGRERAAGILRRLTENSDNGWSISAHGGITVLLKICSDAAACRKELIGLACQILSNLGSAEEMRRFMVEEGAIPVLLQLSMSKEEESRIQAIECLHSMASADNGIRQIVVREGLIASITEFSSTAREAALKATDLLHSADSLAVLMSSGFLDRALFFLKHGDVSVQELVLKSISRLCELSEDYRKAMGDAGYMTELVSLLEAKSAGVREKAAETIHNMICAQRNRRRLIQDEHDVDRIMRALDLVEGNSATRKHLLSVLKAVAESNSGRRRIMASGCVHCLQRLAEADEVDARKVMKKLSARNRFRSILNGFWSY